MRNRGGPDKKYGKMRATKGPHVAEVLTLTLVTLGMPKLVAVVTNSKVSKISSMVFEFSFFIKQTKY